MKTLADVLTEHPTPWRVTTGREQRHEAARWYIHDANDNEVDVTGDSDDDARLGAYVEAVNAMGVLRERAKAKREFGSVAVRRGVFTHEYEMAARRFSDMDDALLAIVDGLEVVHG